MSEKLIWYNKEAYAMPHTKNTRASVIRVIDKNMVIRFATDNLPASSGDCVFVAQ
jgi:hypothetical protein